MRIGRPLKHATPGQRASLGLKVTPKIKTQLDKAARINGRTQSQEAETRLEQSFRDDRVLEAISALRGSVNHSDSSIAINVARVCLKLDDMLGTLAEKMK